MSTVLKIILVLVILVFLFPKPYVSSPGFTTMEYAEQFEQTKKDCIGFSYLKNKMEVAADAPGKSLCFGWLI